MNTSLFIARRYLFSKKKTNVINIISLISIVGLSIGTFALITSISVFNGFDSLIQSRFSSFDPDLKIVVAEGKMFQDTTTSFQEIKKLSSISSYTREFEDNALLRYGKRQTIARVKGIEPSFLKYSGITKMMVDGSPILKKGNAECMILGGGVAASLRIGLNFVKPVNIYYPKKDLRLKINLSNNFRHLLAYPSGSFSVDANIDNKYALVSLPMAYSLFKVDSENVTSINITIKESQKENINVIQKQIQNTLGSKYIVKNRYQQHETYFKIMKSEKWAIYLILAFILFVASFNLVGSITMLVIDKEEDISTLRSMGANDHLIKNIFLFEGWMISLIGAVIGMLLGITVCLIQQHFGIVKLQGAGSFIVDSYPVKLMLSDTLIVFSTILILGFLASWIPVNFLKLKSHKL